jgi:hypothetical protein
VNRDEKEMMQVAAASAAIPQAPQIQALIAQGLTPAEAAASLQFDSMIATAEAIRAEKAVDKSTADSAAVRVNLDPLDLTDAEKIALKDTLVAAAIAGDRTTARFLYGRNQVSADNRFKSKLPTNSHKIVILNQLAANANARALES